MTTKSNEYIEKLKYEVYERKEPQLRDISFAMVNAVVSLKKEVDELNKKLEARKKK